MEDTAGGLEAVSLFSNCGAGDVGFARAGFRFRVLAEIDERRLHVALRNHGDACGVVGDLRKTWPEVVSPYRERCGDVSAGRATRAVGLSLPGTLRLDTADPENAACPVCAAPLLRPVVRKAKDSYRPVKGLRNSSYTRTAPDVPAATVTTASGHVGSDLTIHPFEHRLLSPFECAYLQTFPDDF